MKTLKPQLRLPSAIETSVLKKAPDATSMESLTKYSFAPIKTLALPVLLTGRYHDKWLVLGRNFIVCQLTTANQLI